ncbi:hypothetical protein [Streptomyces uncialis]|uniref:hypothetical protein n=1 Tax=Streptomyces uncialis TaxID=1048205 RepID=UPI0037A26018
MTIRNPDDYLGADRPRAPALPGAAVAGTEVTDRPVGAADRHGAVYPGSQAAR